jgi:antibiotic biosynthesis monooxygenase (ABM) superfamily enzyme
MPTARTRRWLAPVTTTLAAWLVAFAVVMSLFSLLGDELAALPLAPRALVISGVLVALMVNLVMPVVNVGVARWVRGAPPSGMPGRGKLRDKGPARGTQPPQGSAV